MPSDTEVIDDDVHMPNAVDAIEPEGIALNGPRLGGHRIHLLPGSTETAASFQIDNEDHTLGNALRWMIMKNPEVEFCGYTIPHPAEAKLHIRIQTYEGTTAIEALAEGLDNLMELCDIVSEKFDAACAAHGKDGVDR